ncbi:RNases MRP/P 32.9 kDa subunit [[Candida] anglica]|uniref:Ribonuclease P protein subunit n=1 Tax=[Candida] anglica TaxID=148631 RepID=A0ABP0ED11_9ASCO
MNRKNPLERHILSRSYTSEAKVQEVLTSRYSVTGEQKPHLILIPTGAVTSTTDKPKALLHREITTDNVDDHAKTRKKSTRLELKSYIKSTLDKQKKLMKKIKHHQHQNKEKVKPFPISKMLSHYEIPCFDEFVSLNNLWQDYMRNLLFSPQMKNLPSLTHLLPRLTTADYTGCLLTVTSSRNSQLIGTRGIVVWDTQYSFILCVPRNSDAKEWTESQQEFSASEQVGGLRVIPKRGSIFAFDVIIRGEEIQESNQQSKECATEEEEEEEEEDCIGFSIIGSRFEFRNVDRSGKKFKNHKVDDLI